MSKYKVYSPGTNPIVIEADTYSHLHASQLGGIGSGVTFTKGDTKVAYFARPDAIVKLLEDEQ